MIISNFQFPTIVWRFNPTFPMNSFPRKMEGTILMDLQELKLLPASGGGLAKWEVKKFYQFSGAKDEVCESFFAHSKLNSIFPL